MIGDAKKDFFFVYYYTEKKYCPRTVQPAVNKVFVKLPRSERPKAIY